MKALAHAATISHCEARERERNYRRIWGDEDAGLNPSRSNARIHPFLGYQWMAVENALKLINLLLRHSSPAATAADCTMDYQQKQQPSVSILLPLLPLVLLNNKTLIGFYSIRRKRRRKIPAATSSSPQEELMKRKILWWIESLSRTISPGSFMSFLSRGRQWDKKTIENSNSNIFESIINVS